MKSANINLTLLSMSSRKVSVLQCFIVFTILTHNTVIQATQVRMLSFPYKGSSDLAHAFHPSTYPPFSSSTVIYNSHSYTIISVNSIKPHNTINILFALPFLFPMVVDSVSSSYISSSPKKSLIIAARISSLLKRPFS